MNESEIERLRGARVMGEEYRKEGDVKRERERWEERKRKIVEERE